MANQLLPHLGATLLAASLPSTVFAQDAAPPAAPPTLDAPEPLSAEEAETSPSTLMDALTQGKTSLDFRYRFEGADQSFIAERGWASTLRTALGYETAKYQSMSGFVEFESIDNVFGDSYNDTVNGKTARSIVADPDSTEVNQAFLRVDAAKDLELRLGRQEISLGNDRFVGAVPWRQNHQSFDGARGLYKVNDQMRLDYSFAMQVNRIFGDESAKGDEQLLAHFLDFRYDVDQRTKLAAYGMMVDFDQSAALSAQTLGLRGSTNQKAGKMFGEDVNLGFTAEFATQKDAADNPIEIDQDYLFLEASAAVARWKLTLATETLGGSGDPGDKFSTPFATLHKFNGFADVFLNTPDGGLEDNYIQLATNFDMPALAAPLTVAATYHDFNSDAGSNSYGNELDLNVIAPLSKRMKLGLRYADFNGKNGLGDTNRFMAWLNFRVL